MFFEEQELSEVFRPFVGTIEIIGIFEMIIELLLFKEVSGCLAIQLIVLFDNEVAFEEAEVFNGRGFVEFRLIHENGWR